MAFIRETSTNTLDEAVTGALSVASLLTATSGIKLGNNIIYNSDAEETLTLDANQNLTIAGDLTVTGNDIKSSSATAITLSGANATIVGDLTVTGGDILGTTDGDLILHSDGNISFVLDDDNDETGQKFYFYNDTTEIATLDESGNLQIDGDLTLSGGKITFGNGEVFHNENDDILYMVAPTVAVNAVAASRDALFALIADADTDTELRFMEGVANKWSIGHDASASDELCWMQNAAINQSTAKMKLETDGDLIIAGDMTVTGNRLTFGNGEYIHNETDNRLTLKASTTYIDGVAEIHSGAATNASLVLNAPSGYDSVLNFNEATNARWTIGMDGSLTNNDLVFCEGSDITTDQYMVFTTINSEECVNIKKTLYVDRIKSNVTITVTPDANADGGTTEAFKIAKDTGTTKFTVTEDGGCTVALGVQCTAVAHTATDDGTGTGTIAAGTSVVSVNANSDANHIIILPAPVVGNIIHLIETGTTGYELRSSAPASIGINGGTGSNAESAIAGAITYVKCVCVSSTNWICSQFDADGDETKVEAAA